MNEPTRPEPSSAPTSRRAVLRTAAWTAPAITTLAAAPAFAASGAPTLEVAWDPNSFRGPLYGKGSTAATTSLDHSGVYFGFTVTVLGATLTDLTCTFKFTDLIRLASAPKAVTRKTTTWLSSTDYAGWAISPAGVGSLQNPYVFKRTDPASSTTLRTVFDGATGGDTTVDNNFPALILITGTYLKNGKSTTLSRSVTLYFDPGTDGYLMATVG
ncbi:hypothetical protein K8Z61_13955 [Nocardioides sp. TRM66260-LWL]|uniref:hypothetical protein n=1 Tax=Nocardioides sp. TRM66260-LWL TaxID=2874478 RepID=UPI001CC43DED|nr:hypothetical protein [Nocardioides sp. TRM66260-LWL]MBZ5735597.1 hypothetical protein [Nocardioides sp. TRM66260-LWL]